MARKGNAGWLAGLVIGVAIIAPFVWLWNTVGAVWFFVFIILGVIALIWGMAHMAGGNQKNSAWISHCNQIDDAWKRGNYDWARQQLQQIAYSMVNKGVTEEEKSRFTQLMTEFAKEDPLYNEVMARILPLIHANPGMVQSQIYKGQPDDIKEQMRYVLYFAHELGHLRREKNGNSYKLYPPGNVVGGEIVHKPKSNSTRMNRSEHHALRKSHSEAQWKRIVEASENFPYLMLDVPNKNIARAECAAMDGCARRWDDPYWERNFPPCDQLDCLCRVIQMGPRQIERTGVRVLDAGENL